MAHQERVTPCRSTCSMSAVTARHRGLEAATSHVRIYSAPRAWLPARSARVAALHHCRAVALTVCRKPRLPSEHLVGVRHLGILLALVPPLPLLLAPAVPLASPRTAPPCAVAMIFLLYPQPPALRGKALCGVQSHQMMLARAPRRSMQGVQTGSCDPQSTASCPPRWRCER